MKGIYTDKDLCPVCKRRHITYDRMEVTNDNIGVCGKECKEKHDRELELNCNPNNSRF